MQKFMLCGTLVASIFTFGCSHMVHADAVEKRVAPNVFDGKLRLKQGAKYKLSFSTTLYHRSEPPVSYMRGMMGEPVVLERVFTEELSADYKVASMDKLGNSKIRITYGDWIREDKPLYNGKSGIYLGRRADEPEIKSRLLKLVAGRSFLMKCNSKGEVIEIYQLPAIRDQVIKDVLRNLIEVSAPTNLKKTAKKTELSSENALNRLKDEMDILISQIFSEKYVKEKFGQLSGSFPDQAVSEGEAWNYEVPSFKTKKGQPSIHDPVPPKTALSQASRILASMDENVVIVQDSRIYSYEQDPFYSSSIKSNTTYSGVSRINRSSGMLIELTSLRSESGTNTHILRRDSNPKSLEQLVNRVTPFSTLTESHIVVQKQ